MDDDTAIAKVLEDEGDEEAVALLGEAKEDLDTPAAVLKQMKFIGTKITEVSALEVFTFGSLKISNEDFITFFFVSIGCQLFPCVRVSLFGNICGCFCDYSRVHC